MRALLLVAIFASSVLAGEKSVADLARELASPDVVVRRAAAYELSRCAAEAGDAAPALAVAIRDEDEYVRKTAVWTLHRCLSSAPDAVPDVIAALSDKRVEVRRLAAGLLYRVPDATAIVGDIVKALGDADPYVRKGGVYACRNLSGATLTPALPGLLACAEKGPAFLRSSALVVLASCQRSEGQPIAVASLGDENWEVREAALRVLCLLPDGPGVAFEKIAPLLSDAHWRPRRRAVFALARIEGPEAESAAVAALADGHDWVRTAGAVVLGKRAPVTEKALAALGKALTDPSPPVRQSAAVAIGLQGQAAVSLVPALAKVFEAAVSTQLRSVIAISLDRIGGDDEVTVAAFRRDAMRENDPTAAFSAVALLSRRPDDEEIVVRIIANLSHDPYAVAAAGRLGVLGPAAGAVLVPVAKRAAKATGVEAAACALILARVGERPVGPAVARIIAAWDETKGAGRVSIVGILRYLGADAAPAVPLLIEAWKSGDVALSHVALSTLGGIGPGAKAALPALVEARRGAPPHVLMFLDEAIAKIRGE